MNVGYDSDRDARFVDDTTEFWALAGLPG